jgi:sugar phosphate isomerase/epimerase
MMRRTFLQSAAGTGLAFAQAGSEARTSGAPIRLGFDTYSVRAFRWEAMQLLEYAAKLKLDGIQISSLGDFASLEPSYLQKVKDRATELGVKIDGGIDSICQSSHGYHAKNGSASEYLARGLRAAHALGAGSMRCYLGARSDREGPKPIEALMEETIRNCRSVRSLALDLGVKIAIENHSGDLEAEQVRTLIEEAGKDYVASCLDTGNPMWLVEDPLYTLEVLGPYVVTTHVRDSAVWEQPNGAAFQWVALGDGNIDFQKFVAKYRETCPHATMQLEIITGRPPSYLNYLEPDFWKVLPKTRAEKFARFVEIAHKGHPFNGFMIIADGLKNPPAEYSTALKEQQRIDLERSLEYAKKTLDVGVNWRA